MARSGVQPGRPVESAQVWHCCPGCHSTAQEHIISIVPSDPNTAAVPRALLSVWVVVQCEGAMWRH